MPVVFFTSSFLSPHEMQINDNLLAMRGNLRHFFEMSQNETSFFLAFYREVLDATRCFFRDILFFYLLF